MLIQYIMTLGNWNGPDSLRAAQWVILWLHWGIVCLAWYAWHSMPGIVCLAWYAWHGMPGKVCLALYAWHGMPGKPLRQIIWKTFPFPVASVRKISGPCEANFHFEYSLKYFRNLWENVFISYIYFFYWETSVETRPCNSSSLLI